MYRKRKSLKKYNPQKTMQKLRTGSETCPFCDIKYSENIVVEETKYNYVLKNKYAYHYWELMDVLDHLMIIPKKHVESLSTLSSQAKVDTINLMAAYEDKGYNVYAREKSNAIKSIPHQHTHLIRTKNIRAKLALYAKKPYVLFKIG